MNRLAHKVALVTGSSSGIGKAMALRFGEEGATVVVRPDGWRSVSRSWRVKRVLRAMHDERDRRDGRDRQEHRVG